VKVPAPVVLDGPSATENGERVDPRLAYEAPQAWRLGTVIELTSALPKNGPDIDGGIGSSFVD
jgi:hypothetical protein